MKDEESWWYDGPFSTWGEWHAFAIGFYMGIRVIDPFPRLYPNNSDVQAEPHYFAGGYVTATVMQYIVITLIATTTILLTIDVGESLFKPAG
jgi:hypothetical protein